MLAKIELLNQQLRQNTTKDLINFNIHKQNIKKIIL